MPKKNPSWYGKTPKYVPYVKPKKNKTRSRNYLAVQKFKRSGKSMVGVFKKRALQVYNGKEWITSNTVSMGIKSYVPVRKYKPVGSPVKMGRKAWSINDKSEKFAKEIVKRGKVQMLRVRLEGSHDGKRRVFTSYLRFSPKSKKFKEKSGASQKAEYVQRIIARVALSKIRSLGYSSSPESKRNLTEGDSKKASRFFIQKIRVDSIQ